ncbi:uncharacterized protein LOC141835604 [Curcuma longa]|uniref:uncharacterized protein LOC141835604 n=1 Tax=Curcuma longa TaxID=136217 RepID=UPI003D9EDEC1
MAENYMISLNLSKIRCPCRRCGNLFKYELDYVRGHLYRWGFDKLYKVWNFHGEAATSSGNISIDNETANDCDFEDDDFEDMFTDLRNAQNINIGAPQFDDIPANMNANDISGSYTSMLDAAKKELYHNCNNFSIFNFLVKLMHVKVLNGWSNKSFDMLLQLLQEAFPKPNAIPNSHYEAKKLLKELGLTYEKIHVCKNDCILFWGEHENKDACPVCKEPRYKYDGMNKKKNAQKILRYFPIKPRLKRLFISEHTAKDMRWHKEKRVVTDGVLRHPADSESWKEFDMSHELFAGDPRNIRLGLATDGFNPFGNMSNAYSMWPVILVNYNLPPWKMMKPSYLIMSLLIPGPKSPGKEIDVYLQPLINDLKELWDDGVEAYDASTKQVFQLHAAVMWTIHDFPAYGTVSGWSTKGYKACPVCLHETKSQRLRSKICYTCHRRFLNVHHPWRKNKNFNGKVEQERPPQQFSGYEILAQLDALPQVTFSKHPTLSTKRKRSFDDTNWVKKSIFFELKYWPDLKLRHNLDVMHIEKNICDALIGTLLNIDGKSKDTLKARLDLQDMGIRSELHLKKVGDKFSKPYASYTLTLEERREFCQFLKSVKFPDGYAANISKNVNVNDGKLYGLKSHDCHVLLQRILPVAIRKFFPKDICGTLIELCEFFKKITARSLHIADLCKMEEEIVLILCKMERIFPPAFFDIMVHLAVHLPREAMLAGPPWQRRGCWAWRRLFLAVGGRQGFFFTQTSGQRRNEVGAVVIEQRTTAMTGRWLQKIAAGRRWRRVVATREEEEKEENRCIPE